jgi:F-type H+-transporting ATPase subunit delta
MMDAPVATRYARALLNVARATGSLQQAEEDLEAISRLLQAREDLRRTLENPVLSRERKLELIDRLFADRARPITLRLLRLLVEKRRESLLRLIYQEFVRLREESEGILRVTILAPQEIPEDLLRSLLTKLERQTGKHIVYDFSPDPSLIGGIQVRYGDFVLDGSLGGALRRLREQIFIEALKQAR